MSRPVYLAQASPQKFLNYILMIAKHLIEQINDLVTRLDGEELTENERKKLEDSTVDQLIEKRETLLMALHF